MIKRRRHRIGWHIDHWIFIHFNLFWLWKVNRPTSKSRKRLEKMFPNLRKNKLSPHEINAAIEEESKSKTKMR